MSFFLKLKQSGNFIAFYKKKKTHLYFFSDINTEINFSIMQQSNSNFTYRQLKPKSRVGVPQSTAHHQ